MHRIIKELRRREVFRSAGLYIGICWILIEASSVMLPTFGAPEWVLRAIIIAAFVGFPVMLVLSWVYDVTSHGIEVQADAADTVVEPFFNRKTDFVVIGVLTVALIFSVYMNLNRGPAVAGEPDPVSVLIADFDNRTGNPLFDGLLEQALAIGIEGAPHVTSYERNSALGLAATLQAGVSALDAAAARLVAVREGINLVLSGSISQDGGGFQLVLAALDPSSGESAFTASATAGGADGVLAAVGELSGEVREQLGDTTLDDGDATAETFTAASLEAAQAYTMAIDQAFEGRHDEAVLLFRKATELDPKFGRAFSGWALSEFKLGRTGTATAHWDKALSLMETMTERERLRTLGLYYSHVTGNFANAVESFSELVEKYPADAAGHNNLAVAALLTLDFQKASEEGRKIMEIYPASDLYRSNYALYAMYSGDFESAAAVADELIADNPGYGTSYLPLAISHIAAGEYDAAAEDYSRMAEASASHHRDSLAALGLADLAMYRGRYSQARILLDEGIAVDMSRENSAMAAVKHIALAEAYLASSEPASAAAEAETAMDMSPQDSIKVAAARVFLELGDSEKAGILADELASKLQPQTRAYGLMIRGAIESRAGRHAEAVDVLRRALDLADLWLVRFELGKAYLRADFFAEAVGEFAACSERVGETAAVFLDEMPSFRHFADLSYWIGRAEQGIGMQASSIQRYRDYLDLRPEGGPLAEDARRRLE